MNIIEQDLRKDFFPALFWGKEVNYGIQNILGHIIKLGGLGIPNTNISAARVHKTSVYTFRDTVVYLFKGTDMNFVDHSAYTREASTGAQNKRDHAGMTALAREKYKVGGQYQSCLERVTRNRAWLTTVPHRLNGTEFPMERF